MLSAKMLLALVTVLTATNKISIVHASYDPYYVEENASYQPQIAEAEMIKYYAKPISTDDPMQCFGQNFEIFDQLQSPEWQLCKREFKKDDIIKNLNGVDTTLTQDTNYMHICATDSPTELLLFFNNNDVQEDSFQVRNYFSFRCKTSQRLCAYFQYNLSSIFENFIIITCLQYSKELC